ncbi:type II secretion system GspH family protein [Patescibacteria group bacterium]|nr:type II secretion system GspH family protein [Patescibacteria group bacterium]
MFNFYTNKTRGFTLVELLVVIAIIGVLASTVLAALRDARVAAQDSRRISDVKQLKTAMEIYYTKNGGRYPQMISPGPTPVAGTVIGDGSGHSVSWLTTPMVGILDTIPSDPTRGFGAGSYLYVRGTAGKGYGIRVTMAGGVSCVTGMNVSPSWWGAPPACPF